ncbi:MAG: hypothetical protein AB7F59_07665 [Bdellovibrionales bacterium]
MAKKEAPANAAAGATSSGSTGFCLADGCKKNTERAEFCGVHFDWYKQGLITKRGAKAKDYEKKLRFYSGPADKAI